MFQAMVDRDIFVAETRKQRAWALTHRQWRVNLDAFDNKDRCGASDDTHGGPGQPKSCKGKLADRDLTGRFSVTHIPETNVLFVYVQQYQEEGQVAYCGALTSSCPDVAAPVTSIDDEGNCDG